MRPPGKAEAMDHPRIDDENIIDRYLAGRLESDDEARFEEHLFECSGCLEQVQWGEELRRGLEETAEAATRTVAAVGLLAWLQRRGRGQLAGLAGLALALVLLPSVLLLRQQAELGRLRSAVQIADSGLTEPTGAFDVISLGVLRDVGEPVEIRPREGTDALLLSLELPVVDADRYRVTVSNSAGEVLWQGEDLEPNLYDTLLVALPPSFLPPDTYRVALEGLTADGAAAAGTILLRVRSDGTEPR